MSTDVVLEIPKGVSNTTYDLMKDLELKSGVSFEKVIKVSIPKGVECIGTNSFCWYKSLMEITLPDTVEIIKEKAFFSCDSLKSITIPSSVKTIESEAFLECENLEYIKLECDLSAIEDIDCFLACSKNIRFELKDGSVVNHNQLYNILD